MFQSPDGQESELSRIIELRASSNNPNFNLQNRLEFAKDAMELSIKRGVDSTILKSGRNLSYIHLLNGDIDEHKDITYQNLDVAVKLNDTVALAYSNQNLGYNYQVTRNYDSAFFYYSNALKNFEDLGYIKDEISVLDNLSTIFSDSKDYNGSDELLIEALELSEQLPNSEAKLNSLRSFYDKLASNALGTGLLDKSIEYHEKAIDISNQMQDGYYNRMLSFNNMAWAYRKMGQYDKALELYELVYIEDKVFEQDPTFYPIILENIAYTRYLSGDNNYDEIEKLFKKGYVISDSLGDDYTKLAVAIDMAKFYSGVDKVDSSARYANESYRLARRITANEILLESMMLLAQLKEGEESRKYLMEYIQLNDSIVEKERSTRNKFARIKFDTDEIQKENERIIRQRQWLLVISAGLVLTSILIYIIITQRAKNQELQFIQNQQKANEEIYNLMLSQQNRVDEARANEKKRISQEIHDGVLGKMFGVRLSLDSLNLSTGPDAVKNRSTYINELKSIETEIRQISHDLNTDFVSGSNFTDILGDLINKQTTVFHLESNSNFDDNIEWENIGNKTKINIYRILQETLQNIYKHANAQYVSIDVSLRGDRIILKIADDGKGFDVLKSKKGIGIKNIKSRVEEILGSVEYKSVVDKGTTVIVSIPTKSSLK